MKIKLQSLSLPQKQLSWERGNLLLPGASSSENGKFLESLDCLLCDLKANPLKLEKRDERLVVDWVPCDTRLGDGKVSINFTVSEIDPALVTFIGNAKDVQYQMIIEMKGGQKRLFTLIFGPLVVFDTASLEKNNQCKPVDGHNEVFCLFQRLLGSLVLIKNGEQFDLLMKKLDMIHCKKHAGALKELATSMSKLTKKSISLIPTERPGELLVFDYGANKHNLFSVDALLRNFVLLALFSKSENGPSHVFLAWPELVVDNSVFQLLPESYFPQYTLWSTSPQILGIHSKCKGILST